MPSTYDNAMAAAGLSPTGGPFDYTSLLPKPATPGSGIGTVGGFTPAQGGTPGFGWGAYGGIPQLPATTTDTSTTTGADLWGQLKTAGGPGVAGNLLQGVDVIGSNLKGVVNPDVKALLAGTAAGIGAGGMGMGPGAPGSDIAYLKLLGDTSQGLQNLGLDQQNKLFSSFPYQQGSTTTTTTDLSALQSIFNAMPNPYLSAMESLRAIGAGMGNWGGGRPSGMDLFNQIQGSIKPTDNSWFYKPWGPTGGGGPTVSTGGTTQGGSGAEDQALNDWLAMMGIEDPYFNDMSGLRNYDTTQTSDVGSLMGGYFGDWYDEGIW